MERKTRKKISRLESLASASWAGISAGQCAVRGARWENETSGGKIIANELKRADQIERRKGWDGEPCWSSKRNS